MSAAWTQVVELQGRPDAVYESNRSAWGFPHEVTDRWSVLPGTHGLFEDDGAKPLCSLVDSNSERVIYRFTDDDETFGLASVYLSGGSTFVQAAAQTPTAARRIMDRVRELVPQGENPDPDKVPITFWTASAHGARSIRRDLDAAEWDSIAENYVAATRTAMERLMTDFRPGVGGQLLFWHGDPGTGKTTALRAIAREWRKWAELHYIVDPDVFFGPHADYMMKVLMGDEMIDLDEDGAAERWRILVLEDCGELLMPNAKQDVGQALARFLNACDGLIGRGLRILVLVTTNEKVDKLHQAVVRPGRCAARVNFETFDGGQAREWLESRGVSEDVKLNRSYTLADLYAVTQDLEVADPGQKVGFG